MKQFFNYHSKISSIELSQAFATIAAPGPFLGFARGHWNTSPQTKDYQLEVYSEPDQYDTCALVVNQYIDQVYRRYIANRYGDDSSKLTFGCITKDGTIHTSVETQINIPIQGSSVPDSDVAEVFLFAVHSPIKEDIENPVTFVAYWNTTDKAIYPLYKKSVEVYYQQTDPITDPLLDSDLTFQTLDAKVKAACTEYATNYDTYTLIGIYGSGTNLDTNTTENFSLVTYFSQFPMTLNYNTAIHSALVKSLSTITALQKRLLGEIGEIRIFAGSTIPEGYLLCDGGEYSQSEYPELYKVIGDQYNNTCSSQDEPYETDSNKFRVPDLQSRFIVGKHPDITEYKSLGKTGGKTSVKLANGELPPHKHSVDMLFWAENHNTLSLPGKASGFYGLRDGVLTKGLVGNVPGNTDQGYPGLNGSVDFDNDTLPYIAMDTGYQDESGLAHENRPPYYVMTYIIRAKI